MNKKAIFMPLLSFFVLIILTYSYYELVVKDVEDKSSTIGLNQAELVNAYNKGIENEFNAEKAVSHSLNSAINEFSKNGGGNGKCNNLWKFNSDCEPDLEKNFINVFTNELLKYGYDAKEIKINDNSITIILNDFTYKKELKNFNLEYSLPIAVRKELDIDLNKLNSLKDQVKKCLEEGKPLNTCTNEKTEVQENLMVFSIENNKNILIYTEKIETKKPVFVFKINTRDTGIKRETVF